MADELTHSYMVSGIRLDMTRLNYACFEPGAPPGERPRAILGLTAYPARAAKARMKVVRQVDLGEIQLVAAKRTKLEDGAFWLQIVELGTNQKVTKVKRFVDDGLPDHRIVVNQADIIAICGVTIFPNVIYKLDCGHVPRRSTQRVGHCWGPLIQKWLGRSCCDPKTAGRPCRGSPGVKQRNGRGWLLFPVLGSSDTRAV